MSPIYSANPFEKSVLPTQYKCGHCAEQVCEQAKEIRVLSAPELHSASCNLELVTTCHKCRKRSIFEYRTNTYERPPSHCAIDENSSWNRLSQHPKPKLAQAPEHVPDRILKYWIRARQNELDNNWVDAETTASKVFEVLLQEIETEFDIGHKGNYVQRLRNIFKAEAVHPYLSDWMENLRLLRNDMTHMEDDDPTEQDISDAIAFLEVFMTYHYTLPQKIEDRRPSK